MASLNKMFVNFKGLDYCMRNELQPCMDTTELSRDLIAASELFSEEYLVHQDEVFKYVKPFEDLDSVVEVKSRIFDF